jgi:multiple sugar transport system permease protein
MNSRAKSRGFDGVALVRGALLALATLVVLTPFVWLVAAVFKDRSVFNEHVLFPPLSEWSAKTMNLENFRVLFKGRTGSTGTVYFFRYLLNSTLYATACTCLQLITSSITGYALAKYEFRGKRKLTLFVLGTMMVPGVLLLAPIYELAVRVGMIDSLWGLVLVGTISVYGVFLFRQAMMGVPNELLDAARVDGASEFTIYFRVVMPLVRPMSAAFCLVSFLYHWNAYFAPNVFLHSQEKLTLPIVLQLYLGQYESHVGVFLAGTAVALLPPIVLFLALQKEFISGLTSGAVKG